MIVVLKKDYREEDFDILKGLLDSYNLKYQRFQHNKGVFLLISGDTHLLDEARIFALDAVKHIERINPVHKEVHNIAKKKDVFHLIAGPCSIEDKESTIRLAKSVKASGATIFRAGAFKPRTSPYSFQGLREEGINILKEVKKQVSIPVATEILDPYHLELFEDIDILQVGARNMQNFELLKELGKTNKTILLKRNPACNLKELLMSAEYIASNGNTDIILCERGIKTFETKTRNTLDLSIVPLLKEETGLPIIVDPSHATGLSKLIEPMSLAAISAGADGLMIEVHQKPELALSDGAQSITEDAFKQVSKKVYDFKNFFDRG